MSEDDNQRLKALEQWIDEPDRVSPGTSNDPLMEKLARWRTDYRQLNYPGPALITEQATGGWPGAWRPILALAAAATVAILAWGLLLEPTPPAGLEPTNPRWVTDTPASRLRDLGAQFGADIAAPERPEDFEFRLPSQPRRPSGFSQAPDPENPQAASTRNTDLLG